MAKEYQACSQTALIASCNIECDQAVAKNKCANSCNDLLNTSATDGWLWHYGIEKGGGQTGTRYECKGEVIVTPSASNTSNTTRRSLLNFKSASFMSRRLNSTAPAPAPTPNLNGCPEGVHFEKSCVCPAGQVNTKKVNTNKEAGDDDNNRGFEFTSNPSGPGYNKACSFNFTRFVHRTNPALGTCTPADATQGRTTPRECSNALAKSRGMFPPTAREIQYDMEPCNGDRVVSVMYTDEIVRFVLIGGTAIKLFSIILLYVVAYSTPKDDNPRDNIKLSLCLATPWVSTGKARATISSIFGNKTIKKK